MHIQKFAVFLRVFGCEPSPADLITHSQNRMDPPRPPSLGRGHRSLAETVKIWRAKANDVRAKSWPLEAWASGENAPRGTLSSRD
jgi:hypothetical protein